MSSLDQHTAVSPDISMPPETVGEEAVLDRLPKSEHPRTDGRRSSHYDSIAGDCGQNSPHTEKIQAMLNAIEGDIALKITHGSTESETFIARASNGLLEDYEYAPDCTFLDDYDDGWFRMVYRNQSLYEFWLYKSLEGLGGYDHQFVTTDGFEPIVKTSTIGRYVTGDDSGTTWRCTLCRETFDSSGPHTAHCWDDHATARDPRRLREEATQTRDPDDESQTQFDGF